MPDLAYFPLDLHPSIFSGNAFKDSVRNGKSLFHTPWKTSNVILKYFFDLVKCFFKISSNNKIENKIKRTNCFDKNISLDLNCDNGLFST
jgi:hypothetical protein